MRGDGDLYDYCVDDPIARVDPDGQFFFPLILGLVGALGLGLGGSYFAASAADNAKEHMTGKESDAAKNAVKKVAEPVALTVATGGAVGGGLAAASGASLPGITPTIPFATKGMELMTQHSNNLGRISDAVRGMGEPGLPPANIPGVLGAIAGNAEHLGNMKSDFKKWYNDDSKKESIEKKGIRLDSKSGLGNPTRGGGMLYTVPRR